MLAAPAARAQLDDRHDRAQLRAGADRRSSISGAIASAREMADGDPQRSAELGPVPLDSAELASSSRIVDANAQPRFPDWRQSARPALVVGSVARSGGSISRSTSACGTSIAGTQATGLHFTSQPNNWRRLSHIIADAIYKRVTGEEGYFDTRVAYVAETGPLNAGVKRIAIMDQDGANNRYHHRRRHHRHRRRASRRRCRRSSTWRSPSRAAARLPAECR